MGNSISVVEFLGGPVVVFCAIIQHSSFECIAIMILHSKTEIRELVGYVSFSAIM